VSTIEALEDAIAMLVEIRRGKPAREVIAGTRLAAIERAASEQRGAEAADQLHRLQIREASRKVRERRAEMHRAAAHG
jgi:hypothetical protein